MSVQLVTARYRQMLAEAIREQERHGNDAFMLRDYMRAYVPRDDEEVIEIGDDARHRQPATAGPPRGSPPSP